MKQNNTLKIDLKNVRNSWAWWCTPLVSELRMKWLVDLYGLKVSLVYIQVTGQTRLHGDTLPENINKNNTNNSYFSVTKEF